VVGDLALAYAHGIDGFELDGSAGGRNTEEFTEMRAVVDLVGRDQVALD
jgi:hypothetical protein